MAVWVGSKDEGAIRNTKDVDILLNRSDLTRAAEAMGGDGFDQAEVDGITMFLDRDDPMRSRGVHVILAGEKIKPHDLYPAPAVITGILSTVGVDAIMLRELSVLKLIAFRRIDQVHIADMIRVGLIDDALAERCRKLTTARQLRKQENLKLRQRLLPYPVEDPTRRAAQTILNSEGELSHFE